MDKMVTVSMIYDCIDALAPFSTALSYDNVGLLVGSKDTQVRRVEVEKEIKKDMPSRLHARRQMMKVFYPVKFVPTENAGKKKNTKNVDLVDKMFNEIAPKYANRNGGYTRIVKIGLRKGDAAMEVLLELV